MHIQVFKNASKKLSFVILIIIAASYSSLAVAGEHVWGVWSTNDDRAMKSAFTLAESKVRS